MPSPPTGPLAVDLDVLKLGTTEDPVCRDDVERALYALTGWQKPQALVDACLAVVDSYATSVALGVVVPRRDGHVTAVTRCAREHLDEHLCPVTVKRVEVPVAAALDEAAETLPPKARAPRVGVRNEPTMTPGQLLLVADTEVDSLTEAQRAARHTLMTRSQGCSTCGRVKSLDEFYRDKARLTGHASRCKDCANAATKARRKSES